MEVSAVIFGVLLGYSLAGIGAYAEQSFQAWRLRTRLRASPFAEVRTPRLRKHLADALRAYRRRRSEFLAESRITHIERAPADVPPYLRAQAPARYPDLDRPSIFTLRQALS